MKTLGSMLVLMMAWWTASGCGKGFQMDYGKPAAQFLQADVAAKGKAYLGRKITIQGVVTKVEVSDPAHAWIYLEHGIRCNLGKFKAMAASKKPGDVVSVDGFLERCDAADILIEPAMLRDPTAPFNPQK